VERDRVTGIAHHRNGDKTDRADAGAGGVEIDPTDTRQIDLRPGMGRSTSCTVRGLFQIGEPHSEISGSEPRGETQGASRLDHQHGKIAATAMAEFEGLAGRLDALRFPPTVKDALIYAEGKPGQKFESAGKILGAPSKSKSAAFKDSCSMSTVLSKQRSFVRPENRAIPT